jgi:DNA-binding MarR family transcriptional regulator
MDRGQLMDDVAVAAADFGAAADAVDQAVAATLSINQTDLRILGAVHQAGRLTAGDAASAAALSLSATTTAIQRLVGAGLLCREADSADHRRVALTVTAHAARRIEDSYGPIGREGRAQLDRWSDAELSVIRRFLQEGVAFQHRHAERIRQAPDPPRKRSGARRN